MVRSSRELTVANLWVGYAESTAVLVGPMIATALLAIDGARLARAEVAVFRHGDVDSLAQALADVALRSGDCPDSRRWRVGRVSPASADRAHRRA